MFFPIILIMSIVRRVFLTSVFSPVLDALLFPMQLEGSDLQ